MREVLRKACDWLLKQFGLAQRPLVAFLICCNATMTCAQNRDDNVLVTALQGSINLISPDGVKPLHAFSHLQRGDSLLMEGSAYLKLIYLNSGRQEIWQGNGEIEILEAEGKGIGRLKSENTVLSGPVVRQIAKTPVNGKIHKFGSRFRSLGGENSVEKIEASYRRMRMESANSDLNPELYLLSALFELREIERIEQVLSDLRASRPGNQEARIVIALYQKALKNLKESGSK